MNKIKYDIIKKIGILNENIETGTIKELNIISWDGNNPELDLREWGYNHEVIGKGITLTLKEFDRLAWFYLSHHTEIIKVIEPGFISEFTVEKRLK